MIRNIILVGIGSFAGGVCRFLCQEFVHKNYPASIPLGTLSVNIIGCFIVGVLYGIAGRGTGLSPEIRLLAATGFCGGFTTFSSFAYENINMLQNGQYYQTMFYVLISLVIGFAAVYGGILLAKTI